MLKTIQNDSHFKILNIVTELLLPGRCRVTLSNRPTFAQYSCEISNSKRSFHSSSQVFKWREKTTSGPPTVPDCCCNSNDGAEGSFTSRQGWNKRLIVKSQIGFQGAPFCKGQPHGGVAEGPFIIRETGIIKILREELGQDVVDYGDIPLTDTHNHKSRKKTEAEKMDEKKNAPKTEKSKFCKVDPDKAQKEKQEREQQNEFEKRQRKKMRDVDRAKHGNLVYSAELMGHNYNKVLKNTVEVAAATKLISDATINILRDDRICVTLGGDHSIAIGTVNGASQMHKEIALLWIDAHTDINTIHSTTSGNFHGMSASFCIIEMQKYMAKIPGFQWVVPRIKAENVAYIATRCVDPDERMFLDKIGIRTYDGSDIDRYGILHIIHTALDRISPDRKRQVHVSFDIDALDNLEVISTGTPVPGGLTLREALVISEEIFKHGTMMSMDLVELNPEIGTPYDGKRSAECAAKILFSILGGVRRGIADPDKPCTIVNEVQKK